MGKRNILTSILAIYSSIPFLITFHVLGIVLFILPVSYLLSCNKYKLSQFIGFDRYKLPQLSFVDKLNCLYCSYANGLSTYYKFKVQELYLFNGSINLLTKFFIYMLYPFFYLSTQLYRVHSAFTYNRIVFPIISYHPLSMREVVKNELVNKQPIKSTNLFVGRLLKKERMFSIILSNGLSAIETFWCPLKNHQADVIYPEHHNCFYDLDDELDMINLIKDFQ